MGKLIRNGIEYGGGNGTDIFKVTQAEYDALEQAGTLVHNALYVITDAPNLNPTASDIEYSSGVSVADSLDSLNTLTDITNQLTWQNSFALRAWGYLHAYQIGKLVIINVLGMYRASATTDWTTFLTLPENIKPCYSSFAGGDNSASMVLGNNNALQITNYLANISVSGQIICYLE